MKYSDKVIEHFENPRNVGSLNENSQSVGTGIVGAPACGDVMKLQLSINNEGIIEDAKLIKNIDVANELQLPPVKIHCSVLAEDAIKAAIKNYRDKNEKT